MREMILAGLLLPLRLYLQPNVFHRAIAALAPDLSEYYSFWQARHKLRDPTFCRALGRLALKILIAFLWVPLLLGALSALGCEVDWAAAAVGVVFGCVVVLAVTTTLVAAFDMAFVVAFITVGVVAFGVAFGVVSDVAFGVVVGVALDVAFVVAGGVAGGVTFSVMLGVAFGLTFGLTGSVLFDTTFGVTFGAVCGVALGVTSLHAIILPLQYLISLGIWMLVRLFPELSTVLWRFSPVRWDEIILLPLPGLVGLLVTLYHTDVAQGRTALAQIAGHHYQGQAAHEALAQLSNEQAGKVTSVPTLAAFEREVEWLSEATPLPAALRNLLFRMRDVSREVASAQASDSATNRVRRLTAAADMLQSLRLQPDRFGPALARWEQIVATELEKARLQQREQEPVPQVYVSDGRPINPAGRPDTALPFRGRTTLFRQLEMALGGREGERVTFLLYGQRRTGKTSALLQLPRRLGSQMIPSFLDLQSGKLGGANDAAGLLGGLADGIVKEAHRHRQVTLPAIERQTLSADPYPALERWLDQIERVLGERTLLLCLDEFETLEIAIREGRLDTRILSTLRNIVQHRRQVAVLLSGSHQLGELPPHWASALISTQTLPVSFLEEPDARDLIERPVQDFPAIYSPPATDHIIWLTHCQPYLVQLTCALLVERMNAARRMPPESYVSVDDVEAVVPLALERGQGYFLDLWHNQVGSDLARRVLAALAHARGEYLNRAAMRQLEDDEIALGEAINTLLRREIIQRFDDGYRILVPLVAAYVRRQTLV